MTCCVLKQRSAQWCRDMLSELELCLHATWALVCARRGKLLNVRDASLTQVTGNAEIQNIKQIMGLQHGKVRTCAPGPRCPVVRVDLRVACW